MSIFGGAAAANSTPSTSRFQSLLDSIWLQRLILVLQTLAVPLLYYFRPICTALALFWYVSVVKNNAICYSQQCRLVYRATRVLNKPLEELSSLLGFDLPSTPLIHLAGIKSDGAIVHWTLPDKPRQKSTLKYAIHLNGVVIGSVPVHESAVTITGLNPGSFYVARVALINNHDFSSKSPPIRFRTKPATTGDYFITVQDGHETDADGIQQLLPRIRPYRGLNDITPASPASTQMTRSASGGLEPKKSTNSRRLSPAALGLDKHDAQLDDSEPPEGAETIQQLTEKLDALRRETEEAEKLAREEEEEELRQKEELLKERDELRAEVNEREKASRNLKREVNTLERQNTAAQNERAKQERLLQQKKQERQKLKDDTVRWDREAEEMIADAERIRQDKEQYLEQVAKEKEIWRTRQAEEADKVRALEDQIKEKTSEIKKLERALKNSSPNGSEPEPNLVEQLQKDAEEERLWQMQKAALQQQYALLYGKVASNKRFYEEQMRYLETLRAERRRQEELAQYSSPPQTQERLPRRGDSQRSRQAPTRLSASDSPRLGAFPLNHSPFANNVNPAPPGFTSAPFLNIQNGMTLPHPTDNVGMSEDDRDRMTGGAAMSPGAGAELLPADLFSSDDKNTHEHVQPLPGLGSLPGLAGLPGPHLPSSAQDYPGTGPVSPASASSRSPSVFASPQASMHNLHIGSSDGVVDADGRSIRSTRSTRATSGGTSSRFSGMFGIKQKNKAMSDEGPPLGKANSMPRQDQFLPGLDAASRKRNSSISGTVFQNPVDGGLEGSADASSAAPSRRGFGLFSREKSGGWPATFTGFGRRPTSPRPGSTHSNELPRPSMDSSRWGVEPWPSTDAAGGARSSPLAIGQGWNPPAPQQSRLFGSRHPSRRPSLRNGAIGPPEDIMEDEDSDALDPDQAAHLAPIGTKPSSGSKKAESAAKLNPNARDFKSLFSGMKFTGKDKARDGTASNDRSDAETPVPSTSNTPVLAGAGEEESPPNSRKSRDTRSFGTNESSLTESGENSAELTRTHSYTNSDAPSPSLAGSSKETLMQKITRKSSSSKFALPTFKREKSRLDTLSAVGATSAPQAPAEDDEDELSTSVSSLKESSQNRLSDKEPRDIKDKDGKGSTRSWSNVLKLGKKKGNETPSLSENSITTEEADEEEGEEVQERYS